MAAISLGSFRIKCLPHTFSYYFEYFQDIMQLCITYYDDGSYIGMAALAFILVIVLLFYVHGKQSSDLTFKCMIQHC